MKRFFPVFIMLCVTLFGSVRASALEPDAPKTLAEERRQFESADAELNQVYRRYQEGLAVVQSADHLKKAQQLWVQCRDENAAAYQTSRSSRHVLKDEYYYHAATIITRSRVQELKTLFIVE